MTYNVMLADYDGTFLYYNQTLEDGLGIMKTVKPAGSGELYLVDDDGKVLYEKIGRKVVKVKELKYLPLRLLDWLKRRLKVLKK